MKRSLNKKQTAKHPKESAHSMPAPQPGASGLTGYMGGTMGAVGTPAHVQHAAHHAAQAAHHRVMEDHHREMSRKGHEEPDGDEGPYGGSPI